MSVLDSTSSSLTKKEDVATKGVFLNEQLLQAGLADLML